MAGEYRSLLAASHPEVRLALTNQPIIGMVVRKDLTPSIIQVLAASKEKVAERYINGLRDGSMVPVTEQTSNKVWQPGELYLTS
jgi:hypothetical protein